MGREGFPGAQKSGAEEPREMEGASGLGVAARRAERGKSLACLGSWEKAVEALGPAGAGPCRTVRPGVQGLDFFWVWLEPTGS